MPKPFFASFPGMGFCQRKETVLLVLLYFSLFLSTQETQLMNNTIISICFPLTSLPRSPKASPSFSSSLVSRINNRKQNPTTRTHRPSSSSSSSSSSSTYNYRSTFKYSMALIVSLPIGTPPQTQQMVLDTGSQLSWIRCKKKLPHPPPTTSFDPSLSSSFSVLPCSHPVCKPRIPDFTLSTSCDQNRLCHYSYFYADGTLAEGNLVRERFTFSSSQSTPPLILGCATNEAEGKGILGMNLGRLSFASQAKISKFSYCVPTRKNLSGSYSTGSFYLGDNPNSGRFKYISLLAFPHIQRSPNFDPLAYTVAMQGIRIGNKKLNISASAFIPDRSGSGQTIIDSGSEFTYLVDEAYDKVREEVVRLVGPKIKRGYAYGGVADMCFDGNAIEDIGRSIGSMVLEFEKGVEIVVGREGVLADVGGGVHCVGIGRSAMLGAASNIIGNIHQQNLWMEFDVANRKVGLGRADCSRE